VEGRNRSGRLRKVRGAEENTNSDSSLGLGVFLIVLASVALVLSRGVKVLGFAQEGDPGSKAFPVALAGLLMIAGLGEMVRWVTAWRRNDARGGKLPDLKHAGTRRLLALLLSMGAYVFLLGPLGFASATLLFCVPWMWALGLHWRGSIGLTVGLVVLIEVLFAGVFQVRLPEGTTVLAIDRFMINL